MSNTPELDRVRQGIETFEQTFNENAELRDRVRQLESMCSMHKMEKESLEKRLIDAETKLMFNVRFATELTTNLADIALVIENAMTKARQGAFRPNDMTKGNTSNQIEKPPLPGFVAKKVAKNDFVGGLSEVLDRAGREE